MIELISPNRVISRWPAIMLAVKRTDREIGRIRFLIVSIRIMNGIRIVGVPDGIMWANIKFVDSIHP